MAELLKLSLEGIDEAIGNYSERAARMQDMSPVFEAGDKYFRAEMNEQFKSQGAFLQAGTKWTPLSPEYAKRKLAKYGPPPTPFGILYATGALEQSLSQEGGDHIKEITPQSGTYGSSILYGKYHQKGGPKLPQRRIIIITKRFQAFMMDAMWTWILRGKKPGEGEK